MKCMSTLCCSLVITVVTISGISTIFHQYFTDISALIMYYMCAVEYMKSLHGHLVDELLCSTVKRRLAHPPGPLLLYQM